MKSMTGFANKQFKIGNYQFQCEIKTLNSRFLALSLTIPDSLTIIEEKITKVFQENFKRGSVYLKLFLVNNVSDESLAYNSNDIKENIKIIQQFTNEFRLSQPTLTEIINILNPFKLEKKVIFNENDYNLLITEISSLIEEIKKYRDKEGIQLFNDLFSRNEFILKSVELLEIELKSLDTVIRNSLNEKIKKCDFDVDKNRFEEEIIFFINKFDYSEEITRLKSHYALFKETLNTSDEAGRKLDFILQEMNRESNTIASKTKTSQVSEIVINLKTEIEKMKEQVQNVE